MKVSNVSFSELTLSEKVDFSMREKLVEASKRSYTDCRYLWPKWPRKRTNKEVSVNSHLDLDVVHLFNIA